MGTPNRPAGSPTPAEVIAEVIAGRNEYAYDDDGVPYHPSPLLVAEAVVTALAAAGFLVVQLPEPVDKSLSLTEETRGYSTYDPEDPWATAYEHRWVTPWSAVEPKPAQEEEEEEEEEEA